MADLIKFDSFKEFWERDPIVVIDSCSLLDLYRYAPKPAKRILDNLKQIEDYIWLPSHVLEEYTRNKKTVIAAANKKYENVTGDILEILKKTERSISSKFNRYGKFNYKQVHTLRTQIEETMKNLKSNAEGFKEIVAAEIKENKEVLKEDEVYGFIQFLKDIERIGKPLSLPKKIEIYSEGEIRYNHLIPPGYRDLGKDKDDKTKTEKFGDLIIWKELLQKAKEVNQPFIFITDDEKEDWWELNIQNSHLGEKVELVGPRPELLSEFNEVAKIGEDGFLMLTLPEFNKHISVINEVSRKEIYLSDLELDPEDTVIEIIESAEWGRILEEQANLTYEFIHGGVLQEMTGEILTDVDIDAIYEPKFDSLYVDYDEDNVVIEGSFSCVASINIETSLSREIHHKVDAKVVLSGNIIIEFKINYDEENNIVKRSSEEIYISNVEISKYEELSDEMDYSDIACIVCAKRPGVHFTNEGERVCTQCSNHFEPCTRCGNLFEEGSLGGSTCDNCIHEED
ncbi:TPA: DUF4935 domain-containing protein [Bacillus toyonensis]|nr:DUF4935 domain-containing protein [Bacillus toyonensis]